MIDSTHDRLAAQGRLIEALGERSFRRARVTMLLGSDEGIRHERRVALTPRHVGRLGRDLASIGLEPRLLVLAGAGERAEGMALPGFTDDDYRDVGARIVGRGELGGLGQVDVVHALKEPTELEASLPADFLRIGALHLASKPPGVKELLKTKNFAALIDGGTVGNCAYLELGGDRTPIVGSMSRFAGAVAGTKVLEGLRASAIDGGRIVVVGGGIAGMSAVGQIPASGFELVVVDPFPPAQERIRGELQKLGFENARVEGELTSELLDGAVGLIFAHRSGAKAAEKVCHLDQIRKMKKGAAISDIAIDQGGSIAHDDYREEDDAAAAREKYQKLLADYHYYAETNMPREAPREASEMHGDSSLTYVTALLALVALEGSPRGVVSRLLSHGVKVYTSKAELDGMDLLDAVVQDLRNGVQIVTEGGEVRIAHPDIERDEALAAWVRAGAEA